MTTAIALYVDNTGIGSMPSITSGAFFPIIRAAAENGAALPEELADLITIDVIEIDGEHRAIINFA